MSRMLQTTIFGRQICNSLQSCHCRPGERRMPKHGIWLCVMGSSVLHLFVFILLILAVTAPQIHMKAMEAFLVTPPSVSSQVKVQPEHHVAGVTTVRRGLGTKRSLSTGQKRRISISATAHDMYPNRSRENAFPAPEQVQAAPGPVESGKVMNAVPGGLATSHSQSESAGSPSAATSSLGTESVGDMSLEDAGAPRFIHRESPVYPFLARKLGKEGKVVLRLTLDEKGRQTDIEVIEKGGFGFTEAAVQAVKQSIFSPAQRHGNPVASRVLIPVKFVLRED